MTQSLQWIFAISKPRFLASSSRKPCIAVPIVARWLGSILPLSVMATSGTQGTVYVDEEDVLHCSCGNDGGGFGTGFDTCSRDREIVEPTEELWPEPLYMCRDCGTIVDLETQTVVGQAA